MNKIIKKTTIIICLAIIFSYIILIFITPLIINSANFKKVIIRTINQKTDLTLDYEGFNFSFSPNLSIYIKFKKLDIKNNKNEQILKAQNTDASFYPLSVKLKKINADYFFFDTTKKLKNPKEKKSKKPYDLAKIPIINILKADIILQNQKKNQTKIIINNFKVISQNKNKTVNFEAQLKSNYLKHKIFANNKNKITIDKNSVVLDNFIIYFENSPLKINGRVYSQNKNYDFTLNGEGIYIKDVKECFLFYMKQKKSEKNFIENFYDFSGLMDINLNFKKGEMQGTITLNDFKTKTVKFDVPMYFKEGIFYFRGKNIDLEANGLFGKEKLHTIFYARNLFTNEKYTGGSLESNVGQRFASSYIPNLKIKNSVNLIVKYFIQYQKPNVEYIVNLKKGSDISYNKIQLGLIDKNRRIYAKTIKEKNNLFLKTYSYSTVKNKETKNIVQGDGLFIRKNNKFHLDYITAQTNDYAPVFIIGSIGKYIKDGYFRGNLKYIAPKKLITGTFDLKDTKYKDFVVQNASIKSDEKNMEIKAKGTYDNEPFSCYIDMINGFEDEVVINNIKLYLKKYTIKRTKNKKPTNQKKNSKFKDKVQNTNLTIKNGEIILDELTFKNIVLQNLELKGFIENNMAYFSMPDIDFAKGTLGATGIYDLDYHASNIDFSAFKIDSNDAASMIFNLQDQFDGYSNAKMNVKTFNKLEFIDAKAEFSIIDGALTKIGNGEFILNSSNKGKRPIKLQLEKITNIDIKKIKAIKSDIKGYFDIHNEKIENIELYNQNKSLSLFAQGNYNITSQNADLCLWGKYSKSSQKGIKILFIPLSWITNFIFRNEIPKENYIKQINKIPPIESQGTDTETFVVGLKGNINNSNSIQVNMKKLK